MTLFLQWGYWKLMQVKYTYGIIWVGGSALTCKSPFVTQNTMIIITVIIILLVLIIVMTIITMFIPTVVFIMVVVMVIDVIIIIIILLLLMRGTADRPKKKIFKMQLNLCCLRASKSPS